MVETPHIKTQEEIDTEIIGYTFYAIQRGECGHLSGARLTGYNDSKGIRTIGYGTVTIPGYNSLNFRAEEVSEDQAVILAKDEMQHKLYEQCRRLFPNYDELLPCYKALILDAAYQGQHGKFREAMLRGDMQEVLRIVSEMDATGAYKNWERNAVRIRMVEMGMMVEDAYRQVPDADPKVVADVLARQMIEKYASENGTDSELTRDELALLYRSVMAAYGCEVTEEEVKEFAMSYPNVATGMHGIGSDVQPPQWQARDGLKWPKTHSGDTTQYAGSKDYNPNPRPRRSLSSNYPRPKRRFIPGFKREPVVPLERFKEFYGLSIDTSRESKNHSVLPTNSKKFIIVHTTDDKHDISSESMASFLENSKEVSCHFLVARNGKCYQFMSPDYCARHAGKSECDGIKGLNSCSIGIEFQLPVGGKLTRAQAATGTALITGLAIEYDIGPDGVRTHAEIARPVGRKGDPYCVFEPVFDALNKITRVRPDGTVVPIAHGAEWHREKLRRLGNLSTWDLYRHNVDPSLADVKPEESPYYVSPESKARADKVAEALRAGEPVVDKVDKRLQPGVPIPDDSYASSSDPKVQAAIDAARQKGWVVCEVEFDANGVPYPVTGDKVEPSQDNPNTEPDEIVTLPAQLGPRPTLETSADGKSTGEQPAGSVTGSGTDTAATTEKVDPSKAVTSTTPVVKNEVEPVKKTDDAKKDAEEEIKRKAQAEKDAEAKKRAEEEAKKKELAQVQSQAEAVKKSEDKKVEDKKDDKKSETVEPVKDAVTPAKKESSELSTASRKGKKVKPKKKVKKGAPKPAAKKPVKKDEPKAKPEAATPSVENKDKAVVKEEPTEKTEPKGSPLKGKAENITPEPSSNKRKKDEKTK